MRVFLIPVLLWSLWRPAPFLDAGAACSAPLPQQPQRAPEADTPASRKGMDYIWRSSDLPGQQAVGSRRQINRANQYAPPAPPTGSKRAGSVCMDYTQTGTTGSGSCSGHGGVRFWMYAAAAKDTFLQPTFLHAERPDSLPASELVHLSAYVRHRAMIDRKKAELAALEAGKTALTAAPATGVKKDTVYVYVQSAPGAPSGFWPSGVPADLLHWLYLSLTVLSASGAAYVIRKTSLLNLPPAPALPQPQAEPLTPENDLSDLL